jgi:hypothetical protein
MDQSKGTIYLRDNAWYKMENVVKMGVSSTVKNRNTTYITGEIERGEYILIVEIPLEKMKILDKCLKMYFKQYHVYKGGGTEFYNRCIIDLIEPYLQQINMEYKILTKEEINVTNRSDRVSNIPNMTKVKQVFNHLNVQKVIQKYKTKKTAENSPFYCKDCCCGFQRKLNYDYHLNTAKHKNRISKQNKPSFLCSICNKSFLHSSSLSRHKTNCKKEETVVPKMDLAAQIKELSERVEKIMKSREEEIKKNQNSISVNCFGNEKLDYITDNDILDCMNDINVSIPVLLEKIHFDPEHPENNNVRIPNKKLPHAEIMNSKSKWELISKKDTIHSMVETAYNILCKTFQEKYHELDVNTQQNFRDFQEIYRDKRIIRDIKSKVDFLILGNTRK